MVPLSLAPYLLFLTALVSADPIHFDLVRRGRNHIIDYAVIADGIRLKYGYPAAAHDAAARRDMIKRASTTDISVINQYQDLNYLATVGIGTPPQELAVGLDTGSADLWVADSLCLACDKDTLTYNANDSSSNVVVGDPPIGQKIPLRYGIGEVNGTIASETVSMGGFTITDQTFVQVDQIIDGFTDSPRSGIMGLAFSSIAITNATPFWEALSNGGQLQNKEMSFWFKRFGDDASAPNVAPGGVFTLGGTNTKYFSGEIEFIDMPTSNPTYWFLSMTNVTVQDKSISISTGPAALAAIDTGTTLIGGPTAGVRAIWNAVPQAQDLGAYRPGFWAFPCNTNIQVSLSFGGKAWPIDPDDMNLGPVDTTGQLCWGGIFDLGAGTSIQPQPGNPSWIVGDGFLKNVYSVFRVDPPSIGFAQLSRAVGGPGTAACSAPSLILTSSFPGASSMVIPIQRSPSISLTGAFSTGINHIRSDSALPDVGNGIGSNSAGSLSSSMTFVTLVFAYSADPIHFDLVRRGQFHNITDYAAIADGIRLKYGYPAAAHDAVARRDEIKRAISADISVINQYQDFNYLATVGIGTPPQKLAVGLDTGSADLWVADSLCLACNKDTLTYNANDSSSNVGVGDPPIGQKIQLRYGIGEVNGTIASEVVSMGNFHNSKYNLCIAMTHATPFWEVLSNGGQLQNKEMSFWLKRLGDLVGDVAPPNVTSGGVFTLGGTNTKYFSGEIDFIDMPTSNPTYWFLNMTNVTVQGESISISTSSAALASIDTGATLIGGPTAAVRAIWNAVPHAQDFGAQMPGFWAFPCNTNVQVSLSFGGKAWSIDPDDMNLGPVDETGQLCLGGIFDLSAGASIEPQPGNPSVLTHVIRVYDFFPLYCASVVQCLQKNVYSVFRADPPSVGFAQLSAALFCRHPFDGNNPIPSGSALYNTGNATRSNSADSLSSSTIFVTLVFAGVWYIIHGLL
ncbi:hypothetical protein NP233_g228 [Leucocoprinus birnbaumii]|uniref:Peptidase A1 domain-containing protein n=1 Tax=Leucocoprinus birnbaumii TaxID=56174 RepID=A0AAD5W435_9AGAR|nr:hypothetical protein NP233_g228 [Leucocoprinus birnbaumii]